MEETGRWSNIDMKFRICPMYGSYSIEDEYQYIFEMYLLVHINFSNEKYIITYSLSLSLSLSLSQNPNFSVKKLKRTLFIHKLPILINISIRNENYIV